VREEFLEAFITQIGRICSSDRAHDRSKQDLNEVAKTLLGTFEVNGRTKDGTTALIVAARHGYREVVWALLDKGAEVNARDNQGATALILAAENGYGEVVQALLDKGADVGVKTSNGVNALTATKDPDVKGLLKQAGAKP
jgi:ankyrin repeat protein